MLFPAWRHVHAGSMFRGVPDVDAARIGGTRSCTPLLVLSSWWHWSRVGPVLSRRHPFWPRTPGVDVIPVASPVAGETILITNDPTATALDPAMVLALVLVLLLIALFALSEKSFAICAMGGRTTTGRSASSRGEACTSSR